MNATSGERGSSTTSALRASVLPAVATLVVVSPLLILGTTRGSLPVTLTGLLVLLVAAPLVAYLAARHHPVARDLPASLLVGLPQLPLLLLLVALAVWLDVRRGRLLAGSGEEAMSYGIGLTVALFVGTVLMLLVALGDRRGAPGRHSSRPTARLAPSR